jgi:Sulfotransferase family
MDRSSSQSPPAPPSGRPRVVYVMGAGRSGSTILGVTLGNCEGIFYGGELDKWLMRSGRPKRDGEERVRFWQDVLDQVDGAQELFGREVHQYLERSSGLFRLSRRSARRRLLARYRSVSEDLYRAIARTSGATYVIDTAHYPLRARELQQLPGIDLYLIFLTRDPHSVVASFEREDVPEARFNAFTTNVYLWLTYLLSSLVFVRHPRERRMLLRHEDFLADPEGVLAWLLRQIDSPAPVPDLAHLRTGFPLQGNRLIDADVVALERRTERPRHSSALTTLLQLPWAALSSLLRPIARPVAGDIDGR